MKCVQNSCFGVIWNLALIEEDTTVIFEIT